MRMRWHAAQFRFVWYEVSGGPQKAERVWASKYWDLPRGHALSASEPKRGAIIPYLEI
jgi:hypothetical protein